MTRSMAATAAALMLAGTASTAQAAVLTFDGVGYYGYGQGPSGGLSTDAAGITYLESGFQLRFEAGPGAHIGDGNYTPDSFDWHDGGDNVGGSYVSLTRQGGGTFDFAGFSYVAPFTSLAVTVDGGPTFFVFGSGSTGASFNGISELRFSGPGSYSIDNISATAVGGAVPEPSAWALLILGFGATGAAMRAARRKGTAVSYA